MVSLPFKPEKVRQVPAYIDPEQLSLDLDLLQKKCLDSGAANAAAVDRQFITFDSGLRQTVESDTRYPSIHWPLNYPKDDLAEAIGAYQWAIFFSMDVDDSFMHYGGGPVADHSHRKWFLKTYEIVSVIESSGFYMGYHLSLGLGTGNCRAVFCADEKRCWPMLKGRTCIHPNKGRPSMEAVGIDASAMAENLDWRQPESSCPPILAGLVMIA